MGLYMLLLYLNIRLFPLRVVFFQEFLHTGHVYKFIRKVSGAKLCLDYCEINFSTSSSAINHLLIPEFKVRRI